VTQLRRIGAQTIRATPMLEYTAIGNDVTNFKNVHANFGTLDEYKTFIESAHASGESPTVILTLTLTR